MSSHHIVRDEQEPALIIVEVSCIPQNVLNSLLEWSPTVVVLSSQVEAVLAMGLKIDTAICNEDEIQILAPKLAHQRPLQLFSVNEGQLQLIEALNYVVATKHKAANIIAEFDSELTYSIENFTDRINIVVYDGPLKWYRVKDGFHKWFAEGQQFRVREDVANILGGIKKTKDNYYTVTKEGKVTVQCRSPFVWLGEGIT